MGDMARAVDCGIVAARLLGMPLPDQPDEIKEQLQAEIGKIVAHTASTPIENLIDLPRMQDPEQIALMSLLMHIIPPAYQINMELFALICCKMVSLSIKHGNCPVSSKGYGSFAVILSSALGNYADAYRFGKLGVDLNHKFDDISVRSAAYFVWAAFASHWNRPIDESIGLFRKGISFGLQSGDHPHTAYSAARCITHLHFRGTPLPELLNEAKEHLDLLHRVGDVTNVELLRPRIRFIEWLQGIAAHGDTLDSDDFDEDLCMTEIRKRGSQSILSHFQTLRLVHRYSCGDLSSAYELAQESESLLNFSAGFITVAEHNFYYSLTLVGLMESSDQEQRKRYEKQLDANQEQLNQWAEACPENFRHLYLLVSAERERIRGEPLAAMHLYDRAIEAASEQGFTNIEALASERAQRFWLQRHKPEFARVYRERALRAYEIWGAIGKLGDLQANNQFNAARTGRTPSTTSLTSSTSDSRSALDLAAVIKANQAISGEIVLERLLAILMNIIMESAGADTGSLILEHGRVFLVQASKKVGDDQPTVMHSVPLDKADGLSRGIVNYVIRTREHLLLDEPATYGGFRNEPYLQSQRPKSILCVPIIYKGNLTGVLYLENNLVAGAFTPDRLEALNLLVSQTAVSIENALLYSKQKQQALAIEQANVVLVKEIADRKRAEQELSQYQDHLEELVKERTKELENAQGRLVDLSRRAGMAEVAAGVLHNVGNVMTSVNVGASTARNEVKALEFDGIRAVAELLRKNENDLANYLSNDPSGKKIRDYLEKLHDALSTDRISILDKMSSLIEHFDHMRKIIAAQQDYAVVGAVTEFCQLEEILETAVSIKETNLRNSGIEVVRDYAALPPILIDRHQLMQVLVNLISNAKHALEDGGADNKIMELRLIRHGDSRVSIEVEDNGSGISHENLTRIFNHGFTTRKKGHGFGLHNSAIAAQQMSGTLKAHSDGLGKGARFVLEIPVHYASEEKSCASVA
jgi:signal transduction histidine kinase